jgi:SOS-response transcriptional repressor LexA
VTPTAERLPLSKQQRKVLAFLVTYFGRHHAYPTYREIAAALGATSPSGAMGHVKRLERKGWVTCRRSENGQLLNVRVPDLDAELAGLCDALAGRLCGTPTQGERP